MAATTTPPLPDAVACAGLSVGYGRPALAGLDLAVAPGETLALLGSSGSGKTTLLNAIAGFVAPLAGQIWLAGQLASGPGRLVPPERRRIGMVFQDYALWPHLSVVDTVAYPLRRAGASKTAAHRDARDILEQMSLGPLAERRPGQLSGGEQQRVGLARALAGAPALYLFDEPTAHLDATLRAQILDEVARRRAADGAAAVYATHDATEALAIADRVAVLHSGRLAQLAPPADVYAAPADLTVARLTGPVSVLTAPLTPAGPHHYTLHVAEARATVPAATITSPANTTDPAILVRPDWARLADPADPDADGNLPGTIIEVRFRGPHTDYHLTTPAGPLLIREPGPPRAAPGPVHWSLLRLRLLPRALTNPLRHPEPPPAPRITHVPLPNRWPPQPDGCPRLYRADSERDYGPEAIEILLQVMEARRDDLVVILAGYRDRMDSFFTSNPGMASRIAHHTDFPDFTLDELAGIADLMVARESHRFSPAARHAFREYMALRMAQPRFANARSVRNAIDRMRLRQANRLVAAGALVGKDDLIRLEPADITVSRIFGTGP